MSCPETATLEEMALDVLPAAERPALLLHLVDCPSCRRSLGSLAETADQLLLAVPPADPPPGFAAAVLARLWSPASQPASSPGLVPSGRRPV
jgi:hypothetical protein